MRLMNNGATPVNSLRFTLPTAATPGPVRVNKKKAEFEGEKYTSAQMPTRAYNVPLPEPLAPSKTVDLTVDYTLMHEGNKVEWQVNRDYAMGWLDWYPIIDGVRDAAAPYRMAFHSSGGLVPVAPGIRSETAGDYFVYECPQPIRPFFVAGMFAYYPSEVKPFHLGLYAIFNLSDALVRQIIAPSLWEPVRLIGRAVGRPAYERVQYLVVEQDKLFFPDRPFLCWINKRWYRTPSVTKINYPQITTKVARTWFFDSWRPTGPRGPVLSWALSSYFGWLTVGKVNGLDQQRLMARHFQKTLNLKYLHGPPQIASPGMPTQPPHLLSFCPHAMLRFLLGEAKYHKILRDLFQGHLNKEVTVADLAKAVNAETHEDYGWFFEEWITQGVLADYRIAEPVTAAPWKKGGATEVTVRNWGKGRMKVVLAAQSLTGERKQGWFWLDGGKNRQDTVHLTTDAPLEWIEVDPDKIVPQSNVENDRWENPHANANLNVLKRTDGTELRGRILEEQDDYYRIQIGKGRTMIAKSTVAKVESTPYGAYLADLKRQAGTGHLDHLALARFCAKNGWGYEARFHALACLAHDATNAEAKKIVARFKK